MRLRKRMPWVLVMAVLVLLSIQALYLLLHRGGRSQRQSVAYIVDKHPPALPVISSSHPRPVKAIKVTPAVEVGILQDRVSDKRVSLLVMLDEASITRMNAYDLSTFRLWLFSKEWRLLNKQLISVARAFDARGRFQPRRALVSRQGRQLYAAFEISPADWQAAHNLLITGGFLRGSEHSVDFEVVVSKSQVKPLKSPPALGQIRLPDPPNHWRKSCRWRWWVLHSPPQRSWDSGWQMGVWSYDQLVGSGRVASACTAPSHLLSCTLRHIMTPDTVV